MTSATQEIQTSADAMHAVDILAFIEAQEIPSLYFETPYYLSPAPGGELVYALLRETLRSTKKIGIAYVVIQTRQHLAAVVPQGQSLVLNTLRWKSEERMHDATDILLEDELAVLGYETAPVIQHHIAAPAEHDMKMKKGSGILVQELNSLLDDEEQVDDDYLELNLFRRHTHLPSNHARPAGSRPYQRLSAKPRSRYRR